MVVGLVPWVLESYDVPIENVFSLLRGTFLSCSFGFFDPYFDMLGNC